MKNLSLILILFFASSSCDKSDDPNPTGELKEGTIIYAGEFESDGCGWLIQVDTAYYFPINLNDSMHNTNQDVLVSFQVLDEKVSCGFPSSTTPEYNKIKILEIKSK